MKLAILALLAAGANASLSVRRLQDFSPPPGECNVDSDCIDDDHPEGMCIPKATASHDHMRRKLFGGIVYTGYCMSEVCMAGETTYVEAFAEGVFADDNFPIPAIKDKGWCDDGTADGWLAYSQSSEASCSEESKEMLSRYYSLSCECPGLDWSGEGENLVCSITDDVPTFCEQYLYDVIKDGSDESEQETFDNMWAFYKAMCDCPISDMDNFFCELKDLSAECETTMRPLVEQLFIDDEENDVSDAAAASDLWEMFSAMSICTCGLQGATKIPEGEEAHYDDINVVGWSGKSLCGETEECKNEAIDVWMVAAAYEASFDTSGSTVAPSRLDLEAALDGVCS